MSLGKLIVMAMIGTGEITKRCPCWEGYVCEDHPDRPFEHNECGGAGDPCPDPDCPFYPLHGLNYLQEAKSGWRKTRAHELFKRKRPNIANGLIHELGDFVPDYLIAPPSRFPFAAAFADSLAKHFNYANPSKCLSLIEQDVRAIGEASSKL